MMAVHAAIAQHHPELRRRMASRGNVPPSDHARRSVGRPWRMVASAAILLTTAACGAAPKAPEPTPTVVMAELPTPAPTRTPRPTYAPRATVLPVGATATPEGGLAADSSWGTDLSPGQQAALDDAQVQLRELAAATFGDRLRYARLTRMSQRPVANEAVRGRFSSLRAPGRPVLTYATVAFNYGPYGDARGLVKGLARHFDSFAPRVFALPGVDQVELMAYVGFREPSGRVETGPGALLSISRETADQTIWGSENLDWNKLVRQHDPMRNVLYVDSRVAGAATP